MTMGSKSIRFLGRKSLGFTLGLCSVIGSVAALFGCSLSYDISPDSAPTNIGTKSAGIIYAIAGTADALYAVSLNAGVWKLSSSNRWKQLSNSPRYAMSIDVDPNNSLHVLVGERDGDAVNARLNDAGLWESYDGGITWTYVLNPLSAPGGCDSQAISAVAFTPDSAVVATTACGIAWRPSPQKYRIFSRRLVQFSFPVMPESEAMVGLGVAQHRIWARSRSAKLIFSEDDGATWAAVTAVSPSTGNPQRGMDFSVAGFDGAAVMPIIIPGQPDARKCGLLVYRAATQDWQIIGLLDENGIDPCLSDPNGLGGKASVRIFNGSDGRPVLTFNTSEYVLRVDPNADFSAFTTKRLLSSADIQTGGPRALDPRFQNKDEVHADLWDFFADLNRDAYFAGGDGGMVQNRPALQWSVLNSGLHTQHVQAMDVVASSGFSRIVYATQDNDGWYADLKNVQWGRTGVGDANWTSADQRNSSFGQISRQLSLGELVEFAHTSGPPTISINNLGPPCVGDPQFLQFVQTLTSETPAALDAVMLVRRPCLDASGQPVVFADSLKSLSESGSPVVIRNRNWSENHDFGTGQSWEIMADKLPMGAHTVFVSNGHQNPHLFVQSTDTTGEVLYQHQFIRFAGDVWEPIYSGLIAPSSCANGLLGWYVPAYVNPYNDANMLLLTPAGVVAREKGAFAADPVITALLTDSGTYPITSAFCGATISAGNYNAFPYVARMLGTPTLGRAIFEPSGSRLISSPYSGAFFDAGDGVWRNFRELLPSPLSPAFSVGFDGSAAYIALAGRGIMKIPSPQKAKIATYITPMSGYKPHLGGGQFILGQLHAADGTMLSGTPVSIRLTDPAGTIIFDITGMQTDSDGRLLAPFGGDGTEVNLTYMGDSVYAGANTRYIK
jgi:hypothetical protein